LVEIPSVVWMVSNDLCSQLLCSYSLPSLESLKFLSLQQTLQEDVSCPFLSNSPCNMEYSIAFYVKSNRNWQDLLYLHLLLVCSDANPQSKWVFIHIRAFHVWNSGTLYVEIVLQENVIHQLLDYCIYLNKFPVQLQHLMLSGFKITFFSDLCTKQLLSSHQ
jgi:hypothetical protein